MGEPEHMRGDLLDWGDEKRHGSDTEPAVASGPATGDKLAVTFDPGDTGNAHLGERAGQPVDLRRPQGLPAQI